jgi:hypothetical protein
MREIPIFRESSNDQHFNLKILLLSEGTLAFESNIFIKLVVTSGLN